MSTNDLSTTSVTTGRADDHCVDSGTTEESMTPDLQMRQGLFAASRVPAKESEIRSFQTLHSPKVHGIAEWLLQYESACRRQEKYLQQIKDLRQQFLSPSDDHSGSTGSGGSGKHASGSFWRPTERIKPTVQRLPPQVCVLQPKPRRLTKGMKKDLYRHGDVIVPSPTNNFLMAPRSLNPPPGARPENESFQVGSIQKVQARLPPIGTLDRNQTDYEPIECIAKRNKLNLTEFLNATHPGRQSPKKSMDVSDVYVQSTKIG